MTIIPWLVALSVVLGVLGGGGLLYSYYLQAHARVQRQRRLDRLERMGAEGADADPGFDGQPLLERLALFITGRMPGEARPTADPEERLLLIRAGFRSARCLVFFHALRIVLPFGALFLMAGYALWAGTTDAWLRTFAVCAVLYLAPKYVLAFLARRRCKRLSEEVPMFVDYLRMMHSVGISFEQSLILLAGDNRIGLPVLASEFAAVNLVIRSGRPRAEALQQMATQMDVPELQELVALIVQAERYGAAIQEPLKSFSQRLSERKRFELQEYVGKMSTKMVVVMVLFLLPALIIVTAGPGFLSVTKALGDKL